MSLNRRQFSAGLAGTALAGSLSLSGCATAPTASSAAPTRLVFLGQAKVFALDPASGAVTTLVDQAPTDGSRPTGVNDGIAVHTATGQIFGPIWASQRMI